MRIHHSGHFKAYTDNLNAALSEAEKYAPELGNMSLVDVLKNIDSLKLPANVSIAILNNGGGYLNHILFFNQLREQAALSRDHNVQPVPKRTAAAPCFALCMSLTR
jgi:Fe-Mn family superoxide dismutase